MYYLLKNSFIKQKFICEIKGYHIFHKEPIKESVWEKINKNIIDGVIKTSQFNYGSHESGRDINFENYGVSNKTGKITKEVKISSYRLTSVCDSKNIGNKKDIIKEIEKRNNRFDYYSILLRREDKKSNILWYYWCFVPKNHYIFEIKEDDFCKKIKINSNDIQVGWKGKNFDINFCMVSF